MLNTRKLLYILPDMAYVAELLPGKKEHSFTIHSFRQINGEFMTEEEDFHAENVTKLLSKLEPDNYHLILPDFLFTNTILEIKETNDSKIKAHVKEKLLPGLELSRETHEIETFVLTQREHVSNIQLTAIEKSILTPIVIAAKQHSLEISGISPLTWTVKSIVSLEPSITIIQIGSLLYAAEHYIGVDQCTMASVEEIENIGETIKTLKGSQPSIQTIYLLSNDLVEEKLKELVSNTLPVQQLTSGASEDEKLPNYVRQIIESGMKTLDISDYPVPVFHLPKVSDLSASDQALAAQPAISSDSSDTSSDESSDEAKLPLPTTPAAVVSAETDGESDEEEDSEEVIEDEEIVSEKTPVSDSEEVEEKEVEEADVDETTPEVEEENVEITPLTEVEKLETIASFAPQFNDFNETETPELAVLEAKTNLENLETNRGESSSPVIPDKPPVRPALKNRSTQSTTKMILLMVGAFIATVAASIAIGLVVLRLTDQQSNTNPTPTPSPTVTTTPTPLPSPSPSPQTNIRTTTDILVVNATTKAGYAGTIKTKLETAGFTNVSSTNAKGEYDETGNFVLMETENAELIEVLAGDSGLELTYSSEVSVEDPQSQYDAVIVLNE